MTREPNTQYVLSLSYGKDSLACLEAIRILGLPLDRIVHAEVWATDTIPADLPPMVEFKKKADEIILKRYGIVVEHICAVERERPLSFEGQFYTIRWNKKIGGECIYGFPMVRAPWCNSKLKLAALRRIEEIDFRETLLSHPQAASCGERERERERGFNRGIPNPMALALQQTQIPNDSGFDTVSQEERCRSVRVGSKATSSTDIYGFPYTGMRKGGMGWCHRLKYTPFLLAPLSRGQR